MISLFRDLGLTQRLTARLMSEAKLYGVGTYKRKPYSKAGPAHKAYPNHLHQCFISNRPNDTWVSDITYVRTKESNSSLRSRQSICFL
jgi:putative transposase